VAKTGIERIWLAFRSFWVVEITLGNSWMAERNLSWRSQMLGGDVRLAGEFQEDYVVVVDWMTTTTTTMIMVEEPGSRERHTRVLGAL
jgi:hypothetical protein